MYMVSPWSLHIQVRDQVVVLEHGNDVGQVAALVYKIDGDCLGQVVLDHKVDVVVQKGCMNGLVCVETMD